VVTAFVQAALTPRVLRMEAALGAADQQVRATDGATPGEDDLISTLREQAAVCREVSAELSLLSVPPLAPLLSSQTERLVESLALFGDQAAAVFSALTAHTAGGMAQQGQGVAARRAAYTPMVETVLRGLYRAQAWLAVLDQETGARVWLPGFAPGAPSLESQLALP
jgi:hypothetical protein